ncbi:hypothetical protein E0L36_14665 [Streptomyces sp. AJS327]|uniref:hypothetical protein n=1 Tax=Streptomyces sp. AJS327 TaxID=2545265 RepID=UPI0015DEBBD3|nr:hypothetical protein [Streptomyces sp. AJS327]MBA0052098.1 hypothetical protein [Streptomyces sp. AJS327]
MTATSPQPRQSAPVPRPRPRRRPATAVACVLLATGALCAPGAALAADRAVPARAAGALEATSTQSGQVPVLWGTARVSMVNPDGSHTALPGTLVLRSGSEVRIADGRLLGGTLRYERGLILRGEAGKRVPVRNIEIDLSTGAVRARVAGRATDVARFMPGKPRLLADGELRLDGRAMLTQRGAVALNSALGGGDLRAGHVALHLAHRAALDLPAERRTELGLARNADADLAFRAPYARG